MDEAGIYGNVCCMRCVEGAFCTFSVDVFWEYATQMDVGSLNFCMDPSWPGPSGRLVLFIDGPA